MQKVFKVSDEGGEDCSAEATVRLTEIKSEFGYCVHAFSKEEHYIYMRERKLTDTRHCL